MFRVLSEWRGCEGRAGMPRDMCDVAFVVIAARVSCEGTTLWESCREGTYEERKKASLPDAGFWKALLGSLFFDFVLM